MATFPTAAVTRLLAYNSDPFDEDTNPYGLGDGGHITLFPQSTDDTATVGQFVADAAAEVETARDAVAQDVATSVETMGTIAELAALAGQEAGAAADSAAAAAASAGSVDAVAIAARLDTIEADDWVTRTRIADAVFATPAEIHQAADKAITASAENTANAIYAVPSGSGTITLNGANGRVQRITATGNITLAIPTNLVNGRYELEVVSSGGPWTLSLAAGWRVPGGKLVKLTQVAGSVDVFLIRPNGSTPAIAATAFADLKVPA